jgi:hypothetical protein
MGLPELTRGVRPLPRLDLGELGGVEQPSRATPTLHPPYRSNLKLAAPLLGPAASLYPVCQRRPGSDHDLVGEVNARFAVIVVVRHEQAIRDHLPQDVLEIGGIVPERTQLRARLLPPDVRASLAKTDQSKQDPTSDCLLLRGKRAQSGIGAMRERDGETTSLVVAQ